MTLGMKREKLADLLVEAYRGTGSEDELTSDDVDSICLSVDQAILECCRDEDLLLVMFLHLDRICRDRAYAEEVNVDKFELIGVMLDSMRRSLLRQMGR